ncbi:hypothetical protein [Chryseobacterium sp. Leaf394]|uniref:hypothetical protein n=1 Tax=Chryseobacterium sp. Leaf394 TaxID=1736361 RepID=UPI000B28C2F3|nr:hypothetical protein [Chryseobacterium sp. Leaf394]
MIRISVGICIIFSHIYFGQSTVLNSIHHNRLMVNALDKIDKTVLDNSDYEGSPFLEDKFLPSKILGEDGIHLLRYNVYQDEIVLKKNEDYFKVPKELVEFHFDNRYVVLLINDKYYIKVSDKINEYSVVKKETVRFIAAKASENGYGQATKARFVSTKPDYFLHDANTGKLIPFKKSDLEENFSAKKEKISTISRKNKLKTDEDYKKFLQELMN